MKLAPAGMGKCHSFLHSIQNIAAMLALAGVAGAEKTCQTFFVTKEPSELRLDKDMTRTYRETFLPFQSSSVQAYTQSLLMLHQDRSVAIHQGHLVGSAYLGMHSVYLSYPKVFFP